MLDGGLIVAANHLLARAPWARARLQPFSGRSVRVLCGGWRVDMAIDADGCLAQERAEGVADVEISLDASVLAALVATPDSALRHVHIAGNVELAESLGFVLRHLRPDLEAELAPYLGDILAHRVAHLAQTAWQTQERTARELGANALEYLRDERRVLVAADELSALRSELIRLRDDVARNEKRLEKLERLPGRLPGRNSR